VLSCNFSMQHAAAFSSLALLKQLRKFNFYY
jgi:hypothetical protein